MYSAFVLSFAVTLLFRNEGLAQQVQQDPGVAGPSLEPVHYYYDEWPTGIAVSSTGRLFSNYPPGLDPTDLNYTVAELTSQTMETPFPPGNINSPPGGRVNYSTVPATSASYPDYLIGVQSVVIDAKDRLWILDTGRVALENGTLLTSAYGGPKLVGVDLTTNSVISTILFPETVAYPDSYLNDLRFDLRPSLSGSTGSGIAYITDSSTEGRNGIVIVDLGSGKSWRHLDNHPSVSAEPGFVMSIWGDTLYSNMGNGMPIIPLTFGSDGIALSADGETLYYSPVSSRYLYGVPTARLRDDSATSELLAAGSVMQLTQKGVSDGLETDSNGLIYGGSLETNSIITFNPANGTVATFLRDPRIEWTDTFSVATDGNIYFTENQLFRRPAIQGGVDKRVKPFVLYRVPLVGGATKVSLM